MSAAIEQEKRAVAVWDKEPGDVVRFVLRRDEWEILLTACVAGATRGDYRGWAGLDVLKTAKEDVDATRLLDALRTIRDQCKPSELIRIIAEKAIEGCGIAK